MCLTSSAAMWTPSPWDVWLSLCVLPGTMKSENFAEPQFLETHLAQVADGKGAVSKAGRVRAGDVVFIVNAVSGLSDMELY
jgi:hypothetical protein